MEPTKEIELRSEKVRNIIGQIPPLLVHSGMGVIALVVLITLTVSYFIPYYETVEGRVEILGDHREVLLPYKDQWRVQTGQQVRVEMDGFPQAQFGVLSGVISKIHPAPVKNGEMFLKVDMDLPDHLTTSNGNKLPFTPRMQGTATIIVSKQRLLLKLFVR